ncbi:hypothetical protein F511_27177 [Dorcoceras hygrometricum]|uniref:Uncharacterized protein n=1 Tax=Dorcoceras hygrometricum TaxID=472368 RepID=A0A2Z7D9M9_9LAMI|nr:hypothetical protein F511_27177 [Dorcoceras hygrometricum]
MSERKCAKMGHLQQQETEGLSVCMHVTIVNREPESPLQTLHARYLVLRLILRLFNLESYYHHRSDRNRENKNKATEQNKMLHARYPGFRPFLCMSNFERFYHHRSYRNKENKKRAQRTKQGGLDQFRPDTKSRLEPGQLSRTE